MLDAETRAVLRRHVDAARREQTKPTECRWGDDERRGTHLGYTSGCRCPDCKAGHAAYRRELRARARIPGVIDGIH